MRVRKRNGDTELVDANKIVRAVERWVDDLDEVNPLRVATRMISGLYDHGRVGPAVDPERRRN